MPTAPKPFRGNKTYQKRPRPSGSTTGRGYGWKHQQFRARILASRPVCELCRNALSTDLHHKDRNTRNLSDDNALAVCERCHHSAIHGAG